MDVTDFNPATNKQDPMYSQTRWFKVLQNDFATRADWCVQNYENANHPPLVEVDKNEISASAGDTVKLTSSASDPDEDELNYKWWNYKEAGTYPVEVTVSSPTSKATKFTVPDDAITGQTIHLILEVEDTGEPVLSRFQRIVIEIK